MKSWLVVDEIEKEKTHEGEKKKKVPSKVWLCNKKAQTF